MVYAIMMLVISTVYYQAIATWRMPKLYNSITQGMLPYQCTSYVYSVTVPRLPDHPLLYTQACINQAASLQKARNMASCNALNNTVVGIIRVIPCC